MNNFLIIPEIKETIKVKVALGMPAGAPITAVKKKKRKEKYSTTCSRKNN